MKRDHRLDTIRGLMLVVMTIDHLDSPLKKLTLETFGYVTATEGFVFLSGLVAGLVYTRMGSQDNQRLYQRSRGRAFDIYFSHLALVILLLCTSLFITPVVLSAHPELWQPLIEYGFFSSLALYASLLYQSDLLNILPMYFIFLLLTPTLIDILEKGRIWWWAVFLSSAALWGSTQFELGIDQLVDNTAGLLIPVEMGYFQISAWQFLFITGLAIGFYRHHYNAPCLPKRPVLFWLCASIALSLFIIHHGHRVITYHRFSAYIPDFLHVWDMHVDAVLDIWVSASRATLAPLRLLNFVVVAYLIARFFDRFPMWSQWRWLSFLGRHSLQVFMYQIILLFAYSAISPQIHSRLLEIALTVVAVASLSLPAWGHEKFRKHYPQSTW